MIKFIAHLPTIVRRSIQEWSEDNASRLAAALAYYTVFSLAPLLVLVIAITGLVWQQGVVRNEILKQVQALVGAQGARFVSDLVNSRGTFRQGLLATIVGVIALVFGALGVFSNLQSSLNTIWNVEAKKARNFWETIKLQVVNRLLSFTMILGIGFLLLVSLIISTGLTALEGVITHILPFPSLAVELINLVISVGVVTILFAMMFKVLPDAKIAWGDVWVGAFITAVLFAIGKTIIGLYLGNSSVASSYGAAGSLIILLLWVYYSAQILFFGAELTQVYANSYGSRIVPEENAVSTRAGARQPGGSRLRRQPARPGTAPVPVTGGTPEPVELENRQTVRFLLGMALTSFVSGVVATFYGLRKR